MHIQSEPASPVAVTLLEEVLERMVSAGLIQLRQPNGKVAVALARELRRLDMVLSREAAAAIVAVRIAGWPPALAGDEEAAAAVASSAFTIAGMLGDESARHVADFLRHLEANIA